MEQKNFVIPGQVNTHFHFRRLAAPAWESWRGNPLHRNAAGSFTTGAKYPSASPAGIPAQAQQMNGCTAAYVRLAGMTKVGKPLCYVIIR